MDISLVNRLAREAMLGNRRSYERLMVIIRKTPELRVLRDKIEEEATGLPTRKKGMCNSRSKKMAFAPSTINSLSGKTGARTWKHTK